MVSSPQTHRCRDCDEGKPLSDFPGSIAFSYCKACNNKRTRASVERNHGGSTRHYHLRQRYGIGATEVAAMIEEQGGFCALCYERPAEQVDHSHKTGQVRGILCLKCNSALGAFRDDREVIRRAIDYLGRDTGADETLF